MKAILKQYGFAVYIIIVAIHLIAVAVGQEQLRFITKLLLMPLLAIAVYASSPAGKDRTVILIAILFSFAGDSFLLFDYINPLYFIFGLISFLITHILYIYYFLSVKSNQPFILKKYPWIVFVIVAYGIGLVYYLYPTLGDLTVPVIIYAIIICTMLICSIYIFKRVSSTAAAYFITGALFFVTSDSLLAIAKFKTTFVYASFLIMLTYCAAQYCIAKGFVNTKSAI